MVWTVSCMVVTIRDKINNLELLAMSDGKKKA